MLPSPLATPQPALREELSRLQAELSDVETKTRSFEAQLRASLGDLIVETHELYALYKQQKAAKKNQRLAQKKRGKNYREVAGLVRVEQAPAAAVESLEDARERKRLYREAMLHVHPDKFSMREDESAAATEVTARLIEIYQSESLQTLRAYHAHIFGGQAGVTLGASAVAVEVLSKDDYLAQEIARVREELAAAKGRHLYGVLSTYVDPLTFAEELRVYYEDRIARLKRRTRTG